MEGFLNDGQTAQVFVNIVVCICFFISAAIFCGAYKISKKPKITKKNSDYTEVISPILAEVLVDGKIDIKNLILTTIAELQIKGNIAIVNDSTIELLHKRNLNLHEIYLVDMIFLDKKSVTFNDINDRFVYARHSTASFLERMSKIAFEIQSKLYEKNIFSKKKSLSLNVMTYLAILMLINLPIIVLKAANSTIALFLIFALFLSVMATIIFFSKLTNQENISEIIAGTLKIDAIKILCNFIVVEAVLLWVILETINISMTAILGIYIINFLTLRFTKSNVLSDKGLEERRKVLELRNFLLDYDLRKFENGEYYILWNKYFAYSAAFGISNPVISDIYKSWNKLEMSLEFTQNLI